ncbi:hypothetical protein QRX25_09465 [Bacillus sp. L381]|uniref:hypothetical protein n=1 Tax=Bacillus TaxID=1386 RepID=UPI000824A855|nr:MULTISPECIES: hypothetical protein [Bacillus]AOC91369.1 uncharacterized protein BARD7_01900 [Bacillus amyloliquefaciens]MCR9038435.1 hypothetical protein [Bacillus velezensis]QUN07795.1 hypothetical protein KEF49_09340 [Bacillus amyloliquefaciens]QYM80909.1 hypothetical protein KTJ85_09455 [Bacillus sp. 7D3]QZY13636.1 hypothetical protein K7B13_09405 [Bacillus amyloliquefaciens]
MGTDKDIAKAYQELWNNRTLPASTLEEAEKAIDLELLDQRTHPRLRKTPEEKFALAVQRIVDSRLQPIEKYELVELHTKRLQFLREERGEQL